MYLRRRQHGGGDGFEWIERAERAEPGSADVIAAQPLAELLAAKDLMQRFRVFLKRRNLEGHVDAELAPELGDVCFHADSGDGSLQREEGLQR